MMRDEFGLDLPFDDWIVRKYAHYLANAPQAEGTRRRDGNLSRPEAHGRGAGVVSNSDRLIVDANLRAVGIHRGRHATVSRNDVRDGKPDPRALSARRLADRLDRPRTAR